MVCAQGRRATRVRYQGALRPDISKFIVAHFLSSLPQAGFVCPLMWYTVTGYLYVFGQFAIL